MKRRVFLGAAVGLPVAALAGNHFLHQEDHAPDQPQEAGEFLTAAEMTLLASIARQIIPKTETGGALEAGVPQRIDEALTLWMTDDDQKAWKAGLKEIDVVLVEGEGTPYHLLEGPEKFRRLKRLDKAAFSDEGSVYDFYKELKSTVCLAYYTSETGASAELAYNPVPGEWVPCMDVSDDNSNWAEGV